MPLSSLAQAYDPEAATGILRACKLPQDQFDALLDMEGLPAGSSPAQYTSYAVQALLLGDVQWQARALVAGFQGSIDVRVSGIDVRVSGIDVRVSGIAFAVAASSRHLPRVAKFTAHAQVCACTCQTASSRTCAHAHLLAAAAHLVCGCRRAVVGAGGRRSKWLFTFRRSV